MQVDEITKLTTLTAQAFLIYISFTPSVSGKSLQHAAGTLLDAEALRMSSGLQGSYKCGIWRQRGLGLGPSSATSWSCVLGRGLSL